MEEYLKIGIITASHGVKGEMKVYPTTDDPARFKKLKTVFLELKGQMQLRDVESVRVSPDQVLLKLKGIEAPEEVKNYRQCGIFVARKDAVPLKKDEYFIADLLGMKVITDEEQELGTLKEVLPTGANDVYIVELNGGGEVLIPAIHECILSVDVESGIMKVHLLPGLLDEA
jgi:16S rRNA processing protein RimM